MDKFLRGSALARIGFGGGGRRTFVPALAFLLTFGVVLWAEKSDSSDSLAINNTVFNDTLMAINTDSSDSSAINNTVFTDTLMAISPDTSDSSAINNTVFNDTLMAVSPDSSDSSAINNTVSNDTLMAVSPDTSDSSAINKSPAYISINNGRDSIPAVFFLHQKQSVKSINTLIAQSSTDSSSAKQAGVISSDDDGGSLSISGYKSFGVSVGELGEVNLEQGLEAVIEGEIRPGTTLRAQLSDQGSSLDGSTREISEFDMMNITLTNKSFNVIAGDQIANWPEGGILSGQKKIVGISAEVTPGRASVSAFGSFSGGNHTVQTVRGREGVQGPYYMTGSGEANIITPVEGTVKARVNGKDMEEGPDADFTVDYDIGAVTFNPRVLIGQDDFIRIEYEYKSFDYRRTFAGGGASYYTKDSAFSVRGVIWSESDDKNQPIETRLSERDKEILRNSGNDPAYATLTARPVHPLDVAKMSVYYPLYRKAYDGSARDTILVYTPYDPLRPDDTKDFFTAWFSPAQTGSAGADYVIDTTVQRGQFVYKYAGAGRGDYTALAPIAAPVRETAGELEARLKLRHVKAALNVAGKESDRNLFSDIDGSDLASAVMFKLNAGERRIDRRSFGVDFDYRYRSRKFRDEIFSADERRDVWGAADIIDESSGREFQSWESVIGGAVVKGAMISVGAGQAFADSLAETEKITADIKTLFANDKFGIDVGAAVFRHHLSDVSISHRRYGKFTARPSKSWEAFLEYNDEWRVDTAGGGGGYLSGTAEFAYLPANLRQSFNAVQYRSGKNFPGSIDTGYALTWNQSAAFSPLAGWRLTGDSRWRHTKINGQSSASTFLMSAVSDVEPASSGFSSRQEYRVNQELASRFEQKMFFIGKGLGTHAYDSTTGEFRPSVNGDHIIQEVEIYDNTSSSTVRKTILSGDWHFRPKKKISGILGDLSWNGVLSLEEHVDSRNGNIATFIPGIFSLFPSKLSGGNDSLPSHPNYADLSYRQDIDYQIQGSLYRSRLYFLPGLRIVRGYQEPAFETALLVERKKNRLTLSVEPKYLSVSRENLPGAAQGGTQNGLDTRDVSAEFIQSIGRGGKIEFYMRERAGMIFDNDKNRAASLPTDSGIYLQIKPGAIYRPARGGAAEISYTFSYVSFNGELDYRMAGGQPSGTNHTVTVISDINAGKHFNLSGLYRGELSRKPGERDYGPVTHVFSLQLKAFL